jgi:hypothetical protein
MCKTQFEDAFLGFSNAKLAFSILLRMRFLNAKTALHACYFELSHSIFGFSNADIWQHAFGRAKHTLSNRILHIGKIALRESCKCQL